MVEQGPATCYVDSQCKRLDVTPKRQNYVSYVASRQHVYKCLLYWYVFEIIGLCSKLD